MPFLKNLFKAKSNGISDEKVNLLNRIVDGISSKTEFEIYTNQLLKYIKKNPDNVYYIN